MRLFFMLILLFLYLDLKMFSRRIEQKEDLENEQLITTNDPYFNTASETATNVNEEYYELLNMLF